jgi:Asp-tRNA(Asn)/Glu-tRNA(Gln) amidotransferase A subunit family amidase
VPDIAPAAPGPRAEPAPLTGRSAGDLAALVRAGRTTPGAVVDAYLARIADVDAAVGAFRRVRADEARAEADAVARRPDLASLPLAGVPVAVKDNLAVAGEAMRLGTRATRDTPQPHDHPVVRRVRDAGAVVVGLTHVPELCIWPFTDGALGTARNPWDRTRTAGGSSAAAPRPSPRASCPVAVGNDGLGSIRIPAATCGVVGVKPGSSVVPSEIGDGSWFGFSENGPLATTVDDAALLLAVLAGRPDLAAPPPPTRPPGACASPCRRARPPPASASTRRAPRPPNRSRPCSSAPATRSPPATRPRPPPTGSTSSPPGDSAPPTTATRSWRPAPTPTCSSPARTPTRASAARSPASASAAPTPARGCATRFRAFFADVDLLVTPDARAPGGRRGRVAGPRLGGERAARRRVRAVHRAPGTPPASPRSPPGRPRRRRAAGRRPPRRAARQRGPATRRRARRRARAAVAAPRAGRGRPPAAPDRPARARRCGPPLPRARRDEPGRPVRRKVRRRARHTVRTNSTASTSSATATARARYGWWYARRAIPANAPSSATFAAPLVNGSGLVSMATRAPSLVALVPSASVPPRSAAARVNPGLP